jgi:S1-C subfamily serine protease
MMTIGKSAVMVLAMTVALSATQARAQERDARTGALEQLNGLVESLVQGVSQSVVQVLVTSYGPGGRCRPHQHRSGDRPSTRDGIRCRDRRGRLHRHQRARVSNARRVEVVLPGAGSHDGGVHSLVNGRGRTVDAAIVGIAREIDLALLKVDDTGLPALQVAD